MPLETFVTGGRVIFEYMQVQNCTKCEENDSKSISSVQECFECHGSGKQMSGGMHDIRFRLGGGGPCYYCNGKGKIELKSRLDGPKQKQCVNCKGGKIITERAKFEFEVKPGTVPGSMLTFKDRGHFNSYPLSSEKKILMICNLNNYFFYSLSAE